MTTSISRIIALASTACGLAAPWIAYSQTADNGIQLEEVLVTAERRSVDVQKVAVAITVISAADMERSGDSEVSQVLRNVPAITLQDVTGGRSTQSVLGGGGAPNISIRGLGTDGPNKYSSTAVYEDGILITGGGAFFHDINRVEVLRGPQGTLYGRGATAGAVNIISNNPTREAEASATLDVGSYNLMHISAMANRPLSDTLSGRIALNVNKRNGIFANGRSDLDDVNARLKLLYQPTDALSVLLGAELYRYDGAGAGHVLITAAAPNPTDWVSPSANGAYDHVRHKHFFAEVNWDLGNMRLTYLPSIHRNESENSAIPFQPTRNIIISPYDRTTTHELRLASDTASPLSWIIGGFYYTNSYRQTFDNANPNTNGTFTTTLTRAQTYEVNSKAVFGELTYALSDRLRLTGGVRESYDDNSHVDYQVPRVPTEIAASHKYNRFDWKARVETNLADDNMLYGMVSTGYRPGGSVNGQSYNPETVTSYEIGSKNRFGSRLIFNAAIFDYEYGGFQAVENFPDPVNAGNMASVIVGLPARFVGGEAEITALITGHDKITLAPAYVNAKFHGNNTTTNPFNGQTLSFITDNGVVPHSPKTSVSGSYEHEFGLASGATWTAHVDAAYQSEFFTDFSDSVYPQVGAATFVRNEQYVQGANTIYNASLNYQSKDGHWRFGAYGRNLGNKIVKRAIIPGPTTLAYVNDPRTIGLIVSTTF